MSKLDDSVYVFCDTDISSYEMTIYTLAMAYTESPFVSVNDEIVCDLAQLLIVVEKSDGCHGFPVFSFLGEVCV